MDASSIARWLLDEETSVIECLRVNDLGPRHRIEYVATHLKEVSGAGMSAHGSWEATEEWTGLHIAELGVTPPDPPASINAVADGVQECLSRNPVRYGSGPKLAVRLWLSAVRRRHLEESGGSLSSHLAKKIAGDFVRELEAENWTATQSLWLGHVEPFEARSGDCRVRPLTPRERGTVESHLDLSGDEIRFAANQTLSSVRLELESSVRREFPYPDPSAFESLLIALMLTDVRYTGHGRVLTNVGSFVPLGTGFGPEVAVDWRGRRALDESSLEGASSLIPMLDRDDSASIRRAARRILWSTSKLDLADRIVDLVVALDGLLTTSARDSLAYQFRVHGALLVGRDPRHRLEVNRQLRDAYKERSSIVHTNKATDWTKARVEELEELARLICRTSLDHPALDFENLVLGIDYET